MSSVAAKRLWMPAIPMSWKAGSILFTDAHLQKAFDEAQISVTRYQLDRNQECKYVLSIATRFQDDC
jgi:hypothetical protein